MIDHGWDLDKDDQLALDRLVLVMQSHDLDVTVEQARVIWALLSRDYCAVWLEMPTSDDELFEMVKPYFKAVEPANPKKMAVMSTVGALRKWLEPLPANARVCACAEFAEESIEIVLGNTTIATAKLTGV